MNSSFAGPEGGGVSRARNSLRSVVSALQIRRQLLLRLIPASNNLLELNTQN